MVCTKVNFNPSISSNLGQQAYQILREMIITLQFKPGQTIYETEIANMLNISRTPTRDAFQLLISEGLVEVLPQRTKRIVSIAESKVKESVFVRLSLENSAFKLVAGNWKDSDRYAQAEKQIQRILDEQRNASAEQDVKQFLQLDEAFHTTILQLAGNETLLSVVYQMRGHLNRFRFLAMKELKQTGHLIEEHEKLLAYLKGREKNKIERLLEQHIGNVGPEIERLCKAFPDYFLD